MKLILSDYANKQLNSIYTIKVYIRDNVYSESFKKYNNTILWALGRLATGYIRFTIDGNYRVTRLDNLVIYYRYIKAMKVFAISYFQFLNIQKVHRQTAWERRKLGMNRRVKPKMIPASKNIGDYRESNINGGTINGMPVKIVQRINVRTRSNMPIFNYLLNGKILCMYDFINPTPFKIQEDGEEKAYADAVNGKRYWIYPNNRKPKPFNIRLTESQLRQILQECIRNIMKII